MIPAALDCPPGEVHVWRIDLDGLPARQPGRAALLSEDERARAEAFLLDETRQRWIGAHGALRLILADYLGAAPQALRFVSGVHGKPALADGGGLHFNLSHTGGLALAAVTRAGPVGVDIEALREIDWRGISRSFFSAEEAAAIAALPASMRPAGFFACWVRKEAFAKAVGAGFMMGFDRFVVDVRPNAPPRLLAELDGRHDPAAWWFEDLGEPGAAAALAIEASPLVVRRYEFRYPDPAGAGPAGA